MMIRFATGVTMTCAATDLIVGLVLIPLSIFLSKVAADDEKEKELWINFMKALSVVCITGFIVHGIIWSPLMYSIIWVALYAAMFMAVRQFFFVGVYKHYGENGLSDKLRFAIDAVSVAMYIAMAVLSLMRINPIRIFTVYGAALIIPGFLFYARKEHKTGIKGDRFLIIALAPQLVGAALILKRIPEFKFIVTMDHNCIYHLCLLFTVIVFYYAAKRSLLQEKINEEEQETFV